MTSFLSLKKFNALEVFLKLKLRKYIYREYITIKVSVLILSNSLTVIRLEIRHS